VIMVATSTSRHSDRKPAYVTTNLPRLTAHADERALSTRIFMRWNE
jgi:hypothetical protein